MGRFQAGVALADDLDVLLAAIGVPPGLRALRDHLVEHLDVLDAAILQPGMQRADTFLAIDGDAILPGGAATEHAGEARSSLRCQLQRLAEDLVGDARAQVDERLAGSASDLVEEPERIGAAIGSLALERACTLDERHVDRHLDLQDVYPIARLRELLHVARHVVWLLLGELEALLIAERV